VRVNEADPETEQQLGALPRRLWLFAAVAALVWALDGGTKALVVAHIDESHPVRLAGGLLYLVQTRNPGAAFSTGTGYTAILTVIAVAVVVAILHWARRLRSLGWTIALGLILGGALGNLTDRFLRAPGPGRGHVVDWLSLLADDGHVWPVFNIADSGVVCGAILAMLLSLRGIEIDGRRSTR